MGQNQSSSEKILELKKKILELHKVLSDDTFASFREATQTTEMIQMYERQLSNLEEEEKVCEGKITSYCLEGNGEKIKYHLTSGNADPVRHLITSASPLGRQLENAGIGDEVKIGNASYWITNIADSWDI